MVAAVKETDVETLSVTSLMLRSIADLIDAGVVTDCAVAAVGLRDGKIEVYSGYVIPVANGEAIVGALDLVRLQVADRFLRQAAWGG